MIYQLIYIVLFLLMAILCLCVGYGIISWAKKDSSTTEDLDRLMRKSAKIGGYALTVLAAIKISELAGWW